MHRGAYRIAGNFRMVQFFAFFAKIRTAKVWIHVYALYGMALTLAKIKTTKNSSEGLTGNSAKVCTSENFPVYVGIHARYAVMIDVCFVLMFLQCLRYRELRTLRIYKHLPYPAYIQAFTILSHSAYKTGVAALIRERGLKFRAHARLCARYNLAAPH